MFSERNFKYFTLLEDKLLRVLVTILPALKNMLSDGTLEAGIERNILAIYANKICFSHVFSTSLETYLLL